MVTATLKRKDTSGQPVDENAADRLADSLGLPAAADSGNRETVAAVVSPAPADSATQTGVAVRTPTAVARVNADASMEGEFDSTDLRIPQLKIVNGSGKLSQTFNQGALLYADEKLFSTPDMSPNAQNPVLTIVPVKIQKQWRESLTPEEVAEEQLPQTFNTLEEAMRVHGPHCAKWIDGQKPRVAASGRCLVLVQEPAGSTHSGFLRTLDGKNYAPAVYYCGGMAYNEFVKVINSKMSLLPPDPEMNPLNDRIGRHFWSYRVIRKMFGTFAVWVPSISMQKDVTGPELRAFAVELRGQVVKDDGQGQ